MPEKDDVSKIHDKYTLSLINPSSHYISLAASIAIAGLIGAFTASTILGASLKKAWAVAFIQPMAMYLVLIPSDMWISSLTKNNELPNSET